MLSLILLAFTVSTTPTPPPEITHIRTSAFCTELHDKIGPAIQGVIVNNGLLKQGDSAMVKMAHDYINGVPLVEAFDARHGLIGSAESTLSLDIARLRDLAGQLSHNIAIMESFLSQDQATNGRASAEAQELAQMKASLERVKAAQGIAINIFSGIAETQSLEDFINEGNDEMSAGLGSKLANSQNVQLFGAGPMSDLAKGGPTKGAISSDPLKNDPALAHGDQFALQSPISNLYKALLVDQRLVDEASHQAAVLIVSGAQKCH